MSIPDNILLDCEIGYNEVLVHSLVSMNITADILLEHPHEPGQNIASALGGLATPPGVFNVALVKKKVHFCCASHSLESPSRSHISPIGIPQRERRWSWSSIESIIHPAITR